MNVKKYLAQLILSLCVCTQGELFSEDSDLGDPGENIDVLKAKTMLNSNDADQQALAVDSLHFHYKHGSDKEKSEISSIICQALKQPYAKPEDWDCDSTPQAQACAAAAAIQLTEAIPLMVQLLKEPPGHSDPNQPILAFSTPPETTEGHPIGPAYRALVDMGPAAKSALKSEVEKTKDKEISSIVKSILKDIDRRQRDNEEIEKEVKKKSEK